MEYLSTLIADKGEKNKRMSERSLPLRTYRSTVLIAKLCRHHLRLYCLACNLNTLSKASTKSFLIRRLMLGSVPASS